MYQPADRVAWDFWTQEHDGQTFLFHLQAPRGLADPEQRHGMATVGGAVSRDLAHWQDLGTVFDTGAPGQWDDRAIWTGSVMAVDGGGFAMLYTGSCRHEDGKIQRVGLARSDDLKIWARVPENPVIEADPTWYLGPNPLHHDEAAWRDPWLMRDPAGDGYLAYITAQARDAAPDRSGCIALARSTDLVNWRVGPPVTSPGLFFMMEVPQVWAWDGRYYLVFCAHGDWVAPGTDVPRTSATFYMVSDRHDGGFRYGGVLADGATGEYAGRLLKHNGAVNCLTWQGYGPDGGFLGAIGDPRPVDLTGDGLLQRR